MMYNYTLTIFHPTGKLLFEEQFHAKNDHTAKQMGINKITKKKYQSYAHRLVRSGKLILFQN